MRKASKQALHERRWPLERAEAAKRADDLRKRFEGERQELIARANRAREAGAQDALQEIGEKYGHDFGFLEKVHERMLMILAEKSAQEVAKSIDTFMRQNDPILQTQKHLQALMLSSATLQVRPHVLDQRMVQAYTFEIPPIRLQYSTIL